MSIANLQEVVIGETRPALEVHFEDNGVPVDMTGGSAVLRGTSPALPGHPLVDIAGVVFDGPSGLVHFLAIGSDAYVSLTDMGGIASATYTLRAKGIDASGKVMWTPEFTLTWVKPPQVS